MGGRQGPGRRGERAGVPGGVPERPGALLRFCRGLGQRWNISMFHYRNHGAAYGRILVGVQLPKHERREFEQILDEIKFPYWEETDNRAYQLYLGNRGLVR